MTFGDVDITNFISFFGFYKRMLNVTESNIDLVY